MKDMWEERCAADEYAYGEEPNAFFKACLDGLPAAGRLLLPGEGEGSTISDPDHPLARDITVPFLSEALKLYQNAVHFAASP